MNLSTARGWTRQFARNANSSAIYSDADIDRAIQATLSRFCRNTRSIISRTTANLAIDDVSAELQLPPSSTGNPGTVLLMPEQIISAVMIGTGKSVEMVSIAELNDLQINGSSRGRVYAAVATNSSSTGTDGTYLTIWPAATAADTIAVQFWVQLVTWTPGVDDTAAQAITLNIPESWLMQILPLGPPAQLQLHEPENMAMAQGKWQEYLALERSFIGAGSLAAQTSPRSVQR